MTTINTDGLDAQESMVLHNLRGTESQEKVNFQEVVWLIRDPAQTLVQVPAQDVPRRERMW